MHISVCGMVYMCVLVCVSVVYVRECLQVVWCARVCEGVCGVVYTHVVCMRKCDVCVVCE